MGDDDYGEGAERPVGMRPVGMRPVGMRPVGMRPVGMRPVGMRPVGMRDDGTNDDVAAGAGYLDPDEWSADIAALFCEYSAVLRMGARLVFDVSEVPVAPMHDAPRYVPEQLPIDPDPEEAAEAAPEAGAAEEAGSEEAVLATALGPAGLRQADAASQLAAAETRLFHRRLRPSAHELTVQVVMRNRLVASIVERPEVAWALKQDIAYALACRADAGFLHGDPGLRDAPSRIPRGIVFTRSALMQEDAQADLLKATRDMLSALRCCPSVRFANAGWILHPCTLDALTKVLTVNAYEKSATGAAVSLDAIASGQLLAQDGMDGGILLGYPFVVSEAAADDLAADASETRIYFSADWSAAWVGADSPLVTVDFSGDLRFDRDETVVKAVMHHDFALTRPGSFIYTDPIRDARP